MSDAREASTKVPDVFAVNLNLSLRRISK